MNKIFSEIRYWFAKYVFRNLPKYCRKIGVQIGNNTIILPGILIGNDVVIGAGSVVTKSVPDGTIVAGVPAKPISTTFDLTKKLVDSLVPTKGMNYKQKKKYLYDRYPKWFE